MTDAIQDAIEAERDLARLDAAFSSAKQKLLARIVASLPADHEERETCYHTIRAISLARSEIVAVINSGRVALARTNQ